MSYDQYHSANGCAGFSYPPRLYARDPSLRMDNEHEGVGWIPDDDLMALPMSEHELKTYNGTVSLPSHAETEAYLRRTLDIRPPIPVNLWAFDNNRKVTTSEMIRLAIWGSPGRRLTLSQICDAIEARYPDKANLDDKPWRRSVRHHLSLKKMFEQIPRPADHPGKGNYWVLNVRHREATRSKGNIQQGGATSEDEFASSGSSSAASPHLAFDDGMFKTESPRPDFLALHPDHPMVSSMRYPGMDNRNRSSLGYAHAVPGFPNGYSHPPNGIDPRLTMAHNSPHPTQSESGGQPMLRRGDNHAPMPPRRTSNNASFGMADEGRARGLPRPRRA